SQVFALTSITIRQKFKYPVNVKVVNIFWQDPSFFSSFSPTICHDQIERREKHQLMCIALIKG
ncbi:hypothetical protein OFN32_25720, partial [Escherichia coli]|nr:hypothetical protein [Escherichia coli]